MMSGQRSISDLFKKKVEKEEVGQAPARVASTSNQPPTDQDPALVPEAWVGNASMPQAEDIADFGLKRAPGEWRSKKSHTPVAQGQIEDQLMSDAPLPSVEHLGSGLESTSRPSTSDIPTSDQSFEPSSESGLYKSDQVNWDEFEYMDEVRQVFDIQTEEWVKADGTEDEFDSVRVGPLWVKRPEAVLKGDAWSKDTRALVVEEVRRQVLRSRGACRQILGRMKKIHPADGWCVLTSMSSNSSKEDGYVQVSYEGYNHLLTLQEVVLGAQGQQLSADVDGGKWQQVSHRCCKPKCTTVGHVYPESHEDNGKRKNCIVWIDCPHCSGAGEQKAILVCTHAPCCVKAHPAYKSLESFLETGICAVSKEAFKTGQYNNEFDAATGLKRQ